MAEMTQIVELLEKQMEMQQQQIEAQRKQIKTLLPRLAPVMTTPPMVASRVPNFTAFDPTAELCEDYWTRFKTFAGANSISEDKLAQVFLTNQTTTTFKLLNTLAGQQTPPKDINDLSMSNIVEFMEDQYAGKTTAVQCAGPKDNEELGHRRHNLAEGLISKCCECQCCSAECRTRQHARNGMQKVMQSVLGHVQARSGLLEGFRIRGLVQSRCKTGLLRAKNSATRNPGGPESSTWRRRQATCLGTHSV
uniref:Retrotransposon gag domain-containing protein n=1 Tax=Trichuris muris TaxID=70415 RepID=A0A5S6R5H4_TRIMR